MSTWPPELDPLPEAESAYAPEITETECRQCRTLIAGLDGRYACPHCGWVNEHIEGHRTLPTAKDDVDYPGPDEQDAPGRKNPLE
ncbi:hypothetical protein [Streptomyces agglomeratus]|uniref:hypothetical protein n=1 Tax=Streptomyces agglomeratus TaxID=285458 RepID=UPI00099F4405|nr:hypothetical protein [Streptomyces agglomeratus]